MPSSLLDLDSLQVASPCHASWDEMDGDEQVRHCSQCSRNVYDLSALTRVEAEDLVFEMEGRLCVRFYRRADGTVLTSDCPVGANTWWRPTAIALGTLFVAILAFFSVYLVGDSGDEVQIRHPNPVVRFWQNVFHLNLPGGPRGVVAMGEPCPPVIELPKEAPVK